MMYPNFETYINEEYVRPIKYLMDHNESDKIVWDYIYHLCEKYFESNNVALAYEKFIEKDLGMDIASGELFKKWKSHFETYPMFIDFNNLEKIFSEEEVASRLGLDNSSSSSSPLESGYRVCLNDSGSRGSRGIGPVLSSLRKASNLSQKDLAASVNITPVYLNMIERERAGSVGFDIVRSILDKLGYDLVIRKR